MVSADKTLLRIERAASLLGVCADTLRSWELDGKIIPVRLNSGHRRYRLSDIEALRGECGNFTPDEHRTVPSCTHTERRHYAKGLCKSCYYNAYYATKPDYQSSKKTSWIKRYGVTRQWHDEQVAKGCAICGTTDWSIAGKPSIDHDHNCCVGCSLCVRGVLCGKCNRMLGHAADNVETLQKAIIYLEENSSRLKALKT
jgi:hypothetical protein